MNYQNRGSTAFTIENIVSMRAQKILSCGNLEQAHHSGRALRLDNLSKAAKFVLRRFISLFGSLAIPNKSFTVVLADTLTVFIHNAKIVLRRRISLFGSLSELINCSLENFSFIISSTKLKTKVSVIWVSPHGGLTRGDSPIHINLIQRNTRDSAM